MKRTKSRHPAPLMLERLEDRALPSASLRISDSAVFEGASATTNAAFTVTLAPSSAQPVTVALTTLDGSALGGSDYQGGSITITFNPGETAKVVTVLVNGDTAAENNESFLVRLSAAMNALIGDDTGVGLITDDDPLSSMAAGLAPSLGGAPGDQDNLDRFWATFG
jgi:hypothetical protein